jgi:hypothetical protein
MLGSPVPVMLKPMTRGGNPSPPRSGSPLSVFGIDVDRSGKMQGDFSIPYILVSVIGLGLTWFVALTWSNTFNVWLDEYRKKHEIDKTIRSPIAVSLIVASIATLFVVVVIYIMMKGYQEYRIVASRIPKMR